MKRLGWQGLVLILLFRWTPARAQEDDERYVCASRPDLVGACFELRGRLSFWNGAPSARIWPVGTKRMLGVHEDVLPPKLKPKLHGFDTEIWGYFTLCPLTRSRPGHMQFVCIESWRNLSTRQRK